MDCKICFEKYDKFEHKPMVINCAHTFCLRCLYDLKNKAFICPTCRNEIKSEKPNVNKLFLATTKKLKLNKFFFFISMISWSY